MTPAYTDDTVTLYGGDCLDVLAELPDCSMDAVVTDPPYLLGFMGREWDTRAAADHLSWHGAWSAECLRVLKPGGHMLAFGGTRTYHRLACAVEDAGFEIRDSITWLYGSGFPKSLDVGKAIDKARTEDVAPTRAVCALLRDAHRSNPKPRREIDDHFGTRNIGGHWFTPNSPLAQCPTWEQWLWLRDWLGFGDELDAEVWRLNGRKGTPGEAWGMREVLSSRQVPDIRNGHGREYGGAMFAGEETGTIEHRTTAPATDAARRWQGWGTALKPASEPIVVARKPFAGTVAANVLAHGTGALNIDATRVATPDGKPAWDYPNGAGGHTFKWNENGNQHGAKTGPVGRWPANVVLTHTPDCDGVCVAGCPVAELDQQSGTLTSGKPSGLRGANSKASVSYADIAAGSELTGYGDSGGASRFFPTFRYQAKAPASQRPKLPDGTAHPTVKPLDLMRWLVRLVTPPGGLVLDPFAGSGTTLQAATLEGFTAVGVERDDAYLAMCRARLAKPVQGGLFGEAVS